MIRRVVAVVLELVGCGLVALALWSWSLWAAVGFVGVVLVVVAQTVERDKR